MSTACLEAPPVAAPLALPAPAPVVVAVVPIPPAPEIGGAYNPPVPAPVPTSPVVTPPPPAILAPSVTLPVTADLHTAVGFAMAYDTAASITIGDDVTVDPECTVEFEIADTSASGATQTLSFYGNTQPWTQIPLIYKANNWGSTYSIKKMKIKGIATKSKWGFKNFAYCSTDVETTCGNYTWGAHTYGTGMYWGNNHYYQKTKEELFREKLQANLRPEIVTKNQQLWGLKLTEEELRARTLLYDLVGDLEFRRYLRKGFIMVTGKSGTMYKISGGHNRIVSYKRANTGRFMPFEEFCVVFSQYNLPFTDGVIMRKLLVEHDEFSLRKKSNVFQVGEPGKFGTATPAILRAG